MKAKSVEAWAIVRKESNAVVSLWGLLIYWSRFEALKRLRGSPVMLQSCAVVKVEIRVAPNKRPRAKSHKPLP